MQKFAMKISLAGGILAFGFGTALADQHEEPATPIELFACSFVEDAGPADLDAWSAEWNKWADKEKVDDYSAWTLAPYYASNNQEFDFLWLGGSPSGQALGRVQDIWLATGARMREELASVANCNVHANYAVLQFKKPPERDDPSNVIISFSDCNMTDGMNFGADIGPALGAWSEYKTGHNSTAGMWVLFPAYGGGGEEFDFKYVEAFNNLEEQGIDWDQYSKDGWQKAEELFAGKLSCDSSRVYLATNRRMAENDDD